jgi:HAT1-interacting factor 1
MAPLLLTYGKALYEIAFSSQGVMGQSGTENVAQSSDVEDEGPVGGGNGKFVFEEAALEGDEEEEEEGDEGGGEAARSGGAEGGEGGEDGVDEPEDDYNAAWEVLDVSRQIYEKIVEEKKDGEGREERLSLAECYDCLGDVSLETGKSYNAQPLVSRAHPL